ncbi:GNAT family N-acetyltransferase [Aggregatimonas sangjinii]|uniref:GNAT family N-acetyltransferase n=1 Tax=Aggregatimonas sangjinii TaxID=2583587 RepID=A0A5B7SUR9_9FLAO|nr:GNAT family N-acetyltransferase [Aggregatimonas sangjinii]
MQIITATEKDIPLVAPLFDAYRIFYNQESDLAGAERFLKKRFANRESVIFLAMNEDEPIAFTQLYTTFSSVSMRPVLILNDLFVSPSHRKKGVGEALLKHAKEYCLQMKYKGLALETAIDNPAQQLYERLGWQKDTHCFHYFWSA